MANHLDLEEQEQLDQIKHFWKQYGNVITWCLVAVLGAFAAWNGYQYWQRNQASQAAALYDDIDKVARSGDGQKLERAFSEMKDRFGSTAYAQQSALVVAKNLYEAGQVDGAKSALVWASEKSGDTGIASVAKLRLSAVLMDAKSYDEALKALDNGISEEFSALVADRRGDVLSAQGKKIEAKIEYMKAYKALEDRADYKRLVEIKLNALGVNPAEAPK